MTVHTIHPGQFDDASSMKSENESVTKPIRINVWQLLIFIPLAVASLLLAVFLLDSLYRSFQVDTSLVSPTHDMQSFVSLEKTKTGAGDIRDLPTEGFKGYTQAHCMTANSAEEAQNALRITTRGT